MIEILYTILQNAAPRLGESLGSALGSYISSNLLAISAPGLTAGIREDPRYIDALQAYEKQLAQANTLQVKDLQAKQEFSRQLLNMLGEWQVTSNQAKLNEIQLIWDRDNWFSKLDRQETYQILTSQQHRLLILASPPEISRDCPASFINNLRTEIRNGTSSFLNQIYPLSSALCPVEFYGDYFRMPISAIDVKRLQNVLGSIPTATIYSEISDYQVSFHLSFWGLKSNVIAQFDMPSWSWEKSYEALREKGLSDIFALREIRQAIVLAHTLFASFVADWYYLSINPFYEPQLLKALQISQDFGLTAELITPYLNILKNFQKSQKELYEKERALPSTSINTASTPALENTVSTLENLLRSRRWREADQETRVFLLQSVGKTGTDHLSEDDIGRFSCADLQKINHLWSKYSGGHFGFSVQKKIWRNSQRNLDRFGENVGWRKDRWLLSSELTFDLSAPLGHLPRGWMTKSFSQFSSLYLKLEKCKIE
jgi:hypothetical protein